MEWKEHYLVGGCVGTVSGSGSHGNRKTMVKVQEADLRITKVAAGSLSGRVAARTQGRW